MAWIEIHQNLWSHPKTYAFAKALKIDAVTAGGHLCRFWCWAIDAAREDGDITHLPPEEIAAAAGWRKSPAALFKALTTVFDGCTSPWIDKVDGRYLIHDWEDYAGKLVERRKKDRDRKTQSKKARNSPPSEPEDPKKFHGNSTGIPTENSQEIRRNSERIPALPYPTVPNQVSYVVGDSNVTQGTVNDIDDRASLPDAWKPDLPQGDDLPPEMRDLGFVQAQKVYQERINAGQPLDTTTRRKLAELCDLLPSWVLVEAIHEAKESARSGTSSFRHVEAIAQSWHSLGITTPEAAKAHVVKHKRSGDAPEAEKPRYLYDYGDES